MKLIKKIINKIFGRKLYHPNIVVDISNESDKINLDKPISFHFD